MAKKLFEFICFKIRKFFIEELVANIYKGRVGKIQLTKTIKFLSLNESGI